MTQSPARNFHVDRRIFIMMPWLALMVAPKNMDITHEQMLQNYGISDQDIQKLLVMVPRGYFMNSELVIYQGCDMTPGAIWCVAPYNYNFLRCFVPDLRREFGVTNDTCVWMGVRVGKIGSVWETLYPTTIGALSR